MSLLPIDDQVIRMQPAMHIATIEILPDCRHDSDRHLVEDSLADLEGKPAFTGCFQ